MDLRQRKQIRLMGYDYSEIGHYFITICIENRKCILGSIIKEDVGVDPCVDPCVDPKPVMKLNDIGEIVNKWLLKIEDKFDVELDIYQIMPNHLHFVLVINSNVGVHHDAPLQRTKHGDKRALLSIIIGYLKMNTTKTIGMNNKIWQRNYYEHIIRNEKELYHSQMKLLEYIPL